MLNNRFGFSSNDDGDKEEDWQDWEDDEEEDDYDEEGEEEEQEQGKVSLQTQISKQTLPVVIQDKATIKLSLHKNAAWDIRDILTRGRSRHAVRLNDDEAEMIREAERWLQDQLENKEPFTVYVFNSGKGDRGDALFELRFAADSHALSNDRFIKSLGGETLSLIGFDNNRAGSYFSARRDFFVIKARSLPPTAAYYDEVTSKIIELTFRSSMSGAGLPQSFKNQVLQLRPIDATKEIIEKRLRDWNAFLRIQEEHIKKARFSIDYSYYRQPNSKGEIVFALKRNQGEIPWDRIKKARSNFINIEEKPKDKSKKHYDENYDDLIEPSEQSKAWRLGKITAVFPERYELRVQLEEEVAQEIEKGSRRIPSEGILSYNAEGDEVNIRRMQEGLGYLSKRQSANVNLSEFIFDPEQARIIEKKNWQKLSLDQLLLPELYKNQWQREAVEGALSAPDLFLIQGPPGTGKTTVIAEICYQIALRGGRTLVASQANLAVDNAMSRLIHNPAIRALRRGNPDRVEEEGQPYIEKNVIATWLSKTAASCKNNLEQRRGRINILETLRKSEADVRSALNVMVEYQPKKAEYQDKKNGLLADISSLDNQAEELARSAEQFQSGIDLVKKLNPNLPIDQLVNEPNLLLINEKLHQLAQAGGLSSLEQLEQDSKKIVEELSKWVRLGEDFKRSRDGSLVDLIRHRAEAQEIFQTIQKKYWQEVIDADQCFEQGIELFYLHFESRQLSAKEQRLKKYIDGLGLQIDRYQDLLENASRNNGNQEYNQHTTSELNRRLFAAQEKLREVNSALRDIQSGIEQKETKRKGLFQSFRASAGKFTLLNFEPLKNPIRFFGNDGYHDIDSWQTAWLDQRRAIDSSYSQLIELFSERDSSFLLQSIKKLFEDQQSAFKGKHNDVLIERRNLGFELDKIERTWQAFKKQYEYKKSWWNSFVNESPQEFSRYNLRELPNDLELMTQFTKDSNSWNDELRSQKAYLERYSGLVTDWVKRLEAGNQQDRMDLNQIYLNNANVIGITCGQSARWDFIKEFKDFDCVIVDEVSKATPPELILPMLKGRKLVLVGDHKQLAPMVETETFQELAQELKVSEKDIAHIKRSLFKELFEKCPNDLRAMLKKQYRMHEHIMFAINQFYQNQLECGLNDPDAERAHKLTPYIGNQTHLVWVNTPNTVDYFDTGDYTTFYNEKEIDIIENLVQKLNQVWEPRVAAGEKPKEVAVITFYGAQNLRLVDRLKNRKPGKEFKNLELRIGTVDRFQGMERPVVIVSLVRNNKEKKIGFAEEPERINVAFSRAQELLVIVGSKKLFCEDVKNPEAREYYNQVFKITKKFGEILTPQDVQSRTVSTEAVVTEVVMAEAVVTEKESRNHGMVHTLLTDIDPVIPQVRAVPAIQTNSPSPLQVELIRKFLQVLSSEQAVEQVICGYETFEWFIKSLCANQMSTDSFMTEQGLRQIAQIQNLTIEDAEKLVTLFSTRIEYLFSSVSDEQIPDETDLQIYLASLYRVFSLFGFSLGKKVDLIMKQKGIQI